MANTNEEKGASEIIKALSGACQLAKEKCIDEFCRYYKYEKEKLTYELMHDGKIMVRNGDKYVGVMVMFWHDVGSVANNSVTIGWNFRP